MKKEARILVSRCSEEVCVSTVLRGRAFDAIIIAGSCDELCNTVEGRGYLYELRYSIGACHCNLPRPPRFLEFIEEIDLFLGKLIDAVEGLKLIRVKGGRLEGVS